MLMEAMGVFDGVRIHALRASTDYEF